MEKGLASVAQALDALAEAVLSAWSEDRTVREVYGWHHPAVTRHDLSNIARSISHKIRVADLDDVDEVLKPVLADVPRRLKLLRAETVAHMFDGNGAQAIPAYVDTLLWLDKLLEPVLYWKVISDPKSMPAHLARKIRSIESELAKIVPDKSKLETQIALIAEATEAAENLPTDMEALRVAKSEVETLSSNAAASFGKISERVAESEKLLLALRSSDEEALKLVEQCGEAYRVTTTKGLAASFEQRAATLSVSMWIWVFGLLSALVVGSAIGSHRVSVLTDALRLSDPNWGVISIHIALSVLSVGAPLWFAWLATKQIGQRFRLAEDYGFKASVAKAYEGYRREAARIDSSFEARLFESALDRLDEAPLRLVEDTSHGSPWQELVSSDAFKQALNKVPDLREAVAAISARRRGDSRLDLAKDSTEK